MPSKLLAATFQMSNLSTKFSDLLRELGTKSHCYSWGKRPHQAWTWSTYWIHHYSWHDKFDWKRGKKKKKNKDLDLKASPNDDDGNLNDEDLPLLSRKFKRLLIKRREDVIRIPKQESRLNNTKKKKAMCATCYQLDPVETEDESDED